jgi:hypothetical protein
MNATSGHGMSQILPSSRLFDTKRTRSSSVQKSICAFASDSSPAGWPASKLRMRSPQAHDLCAAGAARFFFLSWK